MKKIFLHARNILNPLNIEFQARKKIIPTLRTEKENYDEALWLSWESKRLFVYTMHV